MILTLTTNSQNVQASKNTLKWIFSGDLQLPENSQISLTSLTVDFADKFSPEKAIPIKCSLIRSDEFNPDGVIFSIPGKSRDISFHANVLEAFTCDSSCPHAIMFTFPGLPVTKLAYVHINFAIHN